MISRSLLDRLSVRIATAMGCAAILGLWLSTGYDFDQRMNSVQLDASSVAARYLSAQQLLSTVRAQMLFGSVKLRDILLSSDRYTMDEGREDIEASYRLVTEALSDYEPVTGSSVESATIARLATEVQQFHDTTLDILGTDHRPSLTWIRQRLNRDIGPRRAAALAISDELQELNRNAFVQQQHDLATLHREAEQNSRRASGVAIVLSMALIVLISTYAGRLEGRLRSQLRRDVRISLELHAALARLDSARQTNRHNARDLAELDEGDRSP